MKHPSIKNIWKNALKILISSLISITYVFIAKITDHSTVVIYSIGISAFLGSYGVLMSKPKPCKIKPYIFYKVSKIIFNPKIFNATLIIGLITMLVGLIA